MQEDQKTDLKHGLTAEEVQSRIQAGLQNGTEEVRTKRIGQIIRENIVTPFNILNAILAALVLSVGSFKNALFMGVIICNVFIGTIQEIRAKKTIDKLSLIAAPKAHVLRDGKIQDIAVRDIVMDDILSLQGGNQVCADCLVMDGDCEVNESLITGESDPVTKRAGDTLLSGSFIVSGSCLAQVIHIGKDNYAQQITQNAKYFKRPNSEIMRSINRIIKTIGIVLIPVGIALFTKQVLLSGMSDQDAIVSTVAALVGMIPEGLVLLTSVVLAVSVIRLSRRRALVQELYSIEMLARVDTLCLDKTGTITEGSMQVDSILPIGAETEQEIQEALSALVHTLKDANPTSDAILKHCPDDPGWSQRACVPFSSARKWSGVSFEEQGTFVMGAAEFVLSSIPETIQTHIQLAAKNGQRVLLLAKSDCLLQEKRLPLALVPIALIFISDRIRASAKETFAFFKEQGVDIKVISGDNAQTVCSIAQKAGLEDADRYVDATTLKTPQDLQEAARTYTVFGRVTPEQKLALIRALKADGHTVAMTGDGVNDVLALKESDCSVAMAAGSDAARTVSQIVLLDSDFSCMPQIVAEGRRSINNLQRSASLFLVKTFFSTIIGVLFIFLSANYPFQPIQFTLISTLTIGTPSFFLALEPNRERIHGRFLTNVIRKSIPGALTMVCNILLLVIAVSLFHISYDDMSTMAVALTGYTGFLILFRVCHPFNLLRAILFSVMAGAFICGFIFFRELFSLTVLSPKLALILLVLGVCATLMMIFFQKTVIRLLDRRIHAMDAKKAEHSQKEG